MKTSQMLQKENLISFAKYFIVGGSAVVIDLVLMYLLTEAFKFWYLASAAISYLVTFFYVFFLNKYWVFKSQKRTGSQLAKFTILAIVNYFLVLLMLYCFTEFLRIYYLLSKLIAIAITVFWNFFLYKVWVYKN